MNFGDIITDNKVLEYQYLPYLDSISNEYVDQYNLIILKNIKGYYQDQTNPNNYNIDQERYISNQDKMAIWRERYFANDILNEKLSLQLSTMSTYFRERLDFEKADMYTGYQYKVANTLKSENIKLAKLINAIYKFQNNKIKSTFNIYHIIFAFIFFIFIFNYFVLNFFVEGRY